MTDIAGVIWEDRHTDVGIYLFSDAAKAVAWAKENAQKYCNRHGELEEHEGDTLSADARRNRWIYDASYGESDHMRVQLFTLDKEKVG